MIEKENSDIEEIYHHVMPKDALDKYALDKYALDKDALDKDALDKLNRLMW